MGATFSFPFVPTGEIYTGNPLTVNDLYVASPGVGNYLMPNGARMRPGTAIYWSSLVETATPTYGKFRYVRYNPTATVVLTAAQLPPVYWKDLAFTTVTPTASEGIAGINAIAGVLLNMTVTVGNWCFIQVAGYQTNMISATSTVAGDVISGNASAITVTRTASGLAPVAKPLYIATSSITSSVSNGIICVEELW